MRNKTSDDVLDLFEGLSSEEAASLAKKMIIFGLSERQKQKGDDMGNTENENPPSLDEIRQSAVGLADSAASELKRQYKIPLVRRDLKRQAELEKQLEKSMNIVEEADKTFAASIAAGERSTRDAEEAKRAPLIEELNRLYKTPTVHRERILELERLLGWSK